MLEVIPCCFGEKGAELLHEIEGEGMASGAGLVEEAGLGVESDGFASGAAIVGEEDVEKGEERVGAVERRAFGAAVELEGGVIDGDEVAEDGEVSGGGLALAPRRESRFVVRMAAEMRVARKSAARVRAWARSGDFVPWSGAARWRMVRVLWSLAAIMFCAMGREAASLSQRRYCSRRSSMFPEMPP